MNVVNFTASEERLQQLRDRINERLAVVGLSARAASLQAGLGADAIRIIMDGRSRRPSYAKLEALASVLGCGIGYLVGNADVPGENPPPPTPLGTLRANLERLMAERNTNPFALAQEVGLQGDYIRNIFRGKSNDPGVFRLMAVAKVLGCSLHDLLGEPEPDRGSDIADPIERRLEKLEAAVFRQGAG